MSNLGMFVSFSTPIRSWLKSGCFCDPQREQQREKLEMTQNFLGAKKPGVIVTYKVVHREPDLPSKMIIFNSHYLSDVYLKHEDNLI